MNEWSFIMRKKKFHARICMFICRGWGERIIQFHIHTPWKNSKCTHTHTHTHILSHTHMQPTTYTHRVMTSGKENYKLWKKCVSRTDRKEWIKSVSLMLLCRAFHWEGAIYLKARWPYRFVLQSFCPGTAGGWFASWSKRMRWSVWRNELKEIAW